MKKISLVLVAAALLVSGNLLASTTDNSDPQKNLSTQIWELLNENNLAVDNYDLTGQVLFTVNSEGEIVVISVDTNDKDLESFVKSKLNYKKVELEEVIQGKLYKLPVRVTA